MRAALLAACILLAPLALPLAAAGVPEPGTLVILATFLVGCARMEAQYLVVGPQPTCFGMAHALTCFVDGVEDVLGIGEACAA